MDVETALNEIIKRLDFMTTCDYAVFHPEFERGVRESIRAIELFKEQNAGK